MEILNPGRAVTLPQSTAGKTLRGTLVITVSGPDILVEGRRVASVSDALAANGDLIAGLKEDLPYSLLRKVMVTAARADSSEVSFAVTPKAVKT